ncbi:MptD family putative ECF transporter S component [Mobiluncus mulieris]|uniref:MptD family putative ECF transporter S component n=1 Tax=Mobiluncus mulieris TaxID=2052 RepID=UPI00019F8F19|nr:MptD family putative ECF transporter S component [Mobiluncus mulieris]EEJ53517.1 conserved hypothetical protein TIGR02185 [Mobiluncus mulieris ATCC 35243]MCV0002666.1 MptD family putative ECF transporter S component [Mobiluncus mulieris]SPX70915.1 conserved hypothetical integral membrane protein [Mobiluncus mulieris]
MKTRDFINIGVFTAIYFVLVFASGMLGIINPLMMFVGFALGIIANGVVIGLFKSRVRKIGALAILGLLVGVLMMLTGHPWVVVILTPLLGLIGDFLYSKGKKGFNILAYALFSLWYVTPWFPVLTDAAGYRQMITKSMGEAYAVQLDWFLSPAPIFAWMGCIFLLGLIGGIFGESVLVRHFRKAGIAK